MDARAAYDERTLGVRGLCSSCLLFLFCERPLSETERGDVTRVVPGDVGHRRRGTRARVIDRVRADRVS